MKKQKKNLIQLSAYIIKVFWKYNSKLLLTLTILSIIIRFVPTINNLITGNLLDRAIQLIQKGESIQNTEFLTNFFAFITLNLILAGVSQLHTYIDQKFDNWADLYLRKHLYNNYLKYDLQSYENSNFIEDKNKLDWNKWKITRAIFFIIYGLTALILTIFLGWKLLTHNITLILVIIISNIPIAIINLKFGERLWNIWGSSGKEKILYSQYQQNLNTNSIEKLEEMKILDYGPHLLNQMTRLHTKFTKRITKNEKKRFIATLLGLIWEYSFTGIALYILFNLLIKQKISIGDFYFLNTALFQFKSVYNNFTKKLISLQADKNILESFYNLMHIKSNIPSGKKNFNTNKISIEFKDVWFKYPKTKKWILKGVSFKINNHNNTALVGKNGSGKTTIIKLILRVYDTNKGKILINGKNIEDINLSKLYKSTGILSQNFNKLGIPVEENISIGNTLIDCTPAKVEKAAKIACAHKFIQEYPLKYKTYLTKNLEDGIIPSGGQWQRIAIARILYRDPSLIILDEPTSAIDAIAEEQIFNNIQEIATKKTLIMVSHRFATIKKADKIFVIENGVIVEKGSHKSLMQTDGLYKEMYTKQSK